MNDLEKSSKNYVGYDYKEIVTDSSKASRYLDCYENFGWIPDENQKQMRDSKKMTLCLKRDRKIMNKAELTRLQRHMEDCIDQIELLETSKTSAATITSFVLAMIGTAFMAGSTFAITHEPPLICLCILLAIPGFIGWGSPYFVFKAMVRKRTAIVAPLVEDKYDEIYEICEKGNHLLGNEKDES